MAKPLAAIEFQGSRAKALPPVLIVAVFIYLFGEGSAAYADGILHGARLSSQWLGLPLAVLFLLFLWAEFRLLHRVIRPDTLTLTRDGWTTSFLGKTKAFAWADYGNAAERWVSSGKSSSRVISLEKREDGKRSYIPGDQYIHPYPVVLEAVRNAQEGRLIAPGLASAPRLYAYGIVPLTALACGIFLFFAVLDTWRIACL